MLIGEKFPINNVTDVFLIVPINNNNFYNSIYLV